MDIFIDPTNAKHKIASYVLRLIANNHGANFNFVSNSEAFQLEKLFSFHHKFYSEISKGPLFDHQSVALKNNRIVNKNGEHDLFASATYLLNCMHEWGQDHSDSQSKSSASNRIQSSQVQTDDNEVFTLMKAIAHLLGQDIKDQASAIFVSHNIDSIHGSLFQDSYSLIKRKKPFKALAHGVRELAGKKSWNNLEFIAQLNSDYGFNSVFFTQCGQGKGSDRKMGADYAVEEIKGTSLKPAFRDARFGILEASIQSSIDGELPMREWMEKINRFRCFNQQLPNAWFTIAKATIDVDTSLRRPGRYGFRNSYGKPFKPLNYKTLEAFDFLEVPLNLSGETFFNDLNLSPDEAFSKIKLFLEKNANNCLIGLNWSNTYFTNVKYNGQLELYKKTMRLAADLGMWFIDPKDLLQKDQISSK